MCLMLSQRQQPETDDEVDIRTVQTVYIDILGAVGQILRAKETPPLSRGAT